MGKIKAYKYNVVAKPINITTYNTRDIAKELGISLSTIQRLVNEPDTKNLLSRFITITREKNDEKKE